VASFALKPWFAYGPGSNTKGQFMAAFLIEANF